MWSFLFISNHLQASGWELTKLRLQLFLDDEYLIRPNVVNRLTGAAGPMDLQFIDLVRISQTQVHARIMAGQITASPLHLRNLKPSLHPRFHSCSDGIAITLAPDQFQGQPVSTIPHVVSQQVERSGIFLPGGISPLHH